MYVRSIREADDLETLLASESKIAEMRDELKAGHVYVVREAYPRAWLHKLRDYLTDVARHSLPNYQPIVQGAPNFHRVYGDPRSYVEGRFHQYSFFPWNMDVFDLFARFRPVYQLNNRINGWPDDKYLGQQAEDNGCIARLTFQVYHRGIGYISRHQDVAASHKFTTVTMPLSDKGVDFVEGGTYLVPGEGEPDLDIESRMGCGDVVFMHSQLIHGVAAIDPGVEPDWLAFRGKWTLILAINKLAGTTGIGNSVAR